MGWEYTLEDGVRAFLEHVKTLDGPDEHLIQTAERVRASFKEMVSGYSEDPVNYLKTSFEAGDYDEMIHVGDIPFTSTCAHHLMPFIGRIDFSYIPGGIGLYADDYDGPKIVGLSKIPRFISIFTRRLQVQERLTYQIAECFDKVVHPLGCGVHIRAYHCCMQARGVRIHDSPASTTAIRGCYRTNPAAKAEFLASVNHSRPIL